jgi:hypothetical protein
VYNHLQFYILKVPFLNARTALFLLPIFVLVFVIAFNFIVKHKPYFALPFLAVISSLMVFHMISGFKVDENYEWQYDRHTFKLIQEIQKIKENEGQVPTLNCYWIYYPSLSYHIPKIASKDIKLAPWGTKVQTDTVFQYYYTEFSELESLNEEYEIIKDFGDAYLLKRK